MSKLLNSRFSMSTASSSSSEPAVPSRQGTDNRVRQRLSLATEAIPSHMEENMIGAQNVLRDVKRKLYVCDGR